VRVIQFSARSLVDIVDIAAVDTWGEQQSRRCVGELRRRIDSLAERPELGPVARSKIEGLRRLRAGRHVIYYLPRAQQVVIVRVLHEKQDLPAHLKPRP
jgi:toxin ParE1/3/4